VGTKIAFGLDRKPDLLLVPIQCQFMRLFQIPVQMEFLAGTGVYSLETGQQVIATSPMTDAEVQVYRQYPDTFFGTLMPAARRSKTPIDLYDFFFSTYQHTPKERPARISCRRSGSGAPQQALSRGVGETLLRVAHLWCAQFAHAASGLTRP
jgi:hypothetical protein